MNAHNEQQARQLLALGLDEFGHHTEAANVRKGTDLDDYKVDLWAIRAALDAQRDAAQEAVGLIVEALKNSQPFAHIYPEAMKRHADALATAEALLSGAAPVAAAPADHTCKRCRGSGKVRAEEGTGPDAVEVDVDCPVCGGIGVIDRPPAAPADTWFADQLTAMGEVIPLDRPPAAPGIDLEQFRLLANHARNLYLTDPSAATARLRRTLIGACDRLLALIDASPKGATFRNYGDSEAQFIADEAHLNCPACGGSGHVEDSPKGGSEAWKPIETAPKDARWLMLGIAGRNEIMLGYWSRLHQGWWGQTCANGEFKLWKRATHWMPMPSAPMQAGDAEVQP